MLLPRFPYCVVAFVRPFKADDKIMRPFDAHRPSSLGDATEPVLNNELVVFNIPRAEAACYAMGHRARETFGQPSVPCVWAGRERRQFMKILSRNLRTTPIKRIAKHLIVFGLVAFQSDSFAARALAKLLLLTPNAPMSGAEVRST